MFIAPPPMLSRSAESASATWAVSVRGRYSVIAGPSGRRCRSRAPPLAPLAGQHGVGRGRAPLAGAVLLGLPGGGPVPLHRVEDLPGQLDLPLAREERRVADQHVQDEPLVGLRAGLGERLA